MDIFERLNNESLQDYILRLADAKKENKSITWQGIADAIAVEYGVCRSERWVRRQVQEAGDLTSSSELLNMIETAQDELDEKTLALKKERVKLADERALDRSYVRKIAREETLKEIAIKTAQEMGSKKILPTGNTLTATGNKEAILCISDWHYGIDIQNPWNEFSPEICKERVALLRDKTIQYLKEHKCRKLYLINLGDLIAGRIHLGLRLDSRFDVITQTIHVSEILAEFISSLSKYVEIEYHGGLDNHSRLEPKKADAQELESLARIIPWYIKERLKDNSNITFVENKWGIDILSFNACGHEVIGCHGDKDTPEKALTHLNNYTNHHYDLMLMAHRHHCTMTESCNTVLVCNGSLMGTDTFATSLRLNSKPSQNLIIVSEDSPMECLYRIIL